MAETGMSFREVPLNKRFPPKCREITHSTGGASGSLQDQKQASHAGGYAYRDSGCLDAPARNRFIYWRTSFDVLELTEESLDVNLSGNHLRICFQGAPILGKVSIHEAHSYVFILVATTSSVHRLMFPHPNKILKNERGFMQGGIKNAASILSEASLASVRGQSSSHIISSPTGSVYHLRTAAGWLTNDGEAIFALATNNGSILLIKFPPYGIQGVVTQHELKQSSVMQRLWSGLVPSAIRGSNESGLICSSLEIHPVGQDIFIFSISFDNKMRMWSTKTQECVMVSSMIEFTPAGEDGQHLMVGSGGHRLCKAAGSTPQSLKLGVFLSFSDHCQFCVFQPVLADGQYQLNHISTIHGPNEELVDMSLSSAHLWTLWTSSDGECNARAVSIATDMPNVSEWLSVFMEPSDTPELEVPSFKDPRQTYTEYIFYPGRFSNYAILRALKTYRRTLDPASNLDIHISRETLMAEVVAAVEHEIQTGASEYELAEDEYHQLQLQQWARFYSCCTQYKQVGLKPLGIFADSVTGMACIVRKNCASLVRPCHLLEHLYLATSDISHLEDSSGQNIIDEDDSVCRDVVRLCSCIRMLGNCLTSTMEQACEQDLYHTQSANVIAQQLISALLTEASLGEATVANVLRDIEVNLYNIQDLSRAVDCLLGRLDLSHGHPEGLIPSGEMTDATRQLSCSHLYSSQLATEALTRTVCQVADTSLHLSRDLLLFLTLVTNLGEQASVPLVVSEQIRSEFISRTAMIVPQYFVLRWCASTIVTPTSSTAMESNLRQLEAIDFSDSTSVTLTNRIVESGGTLLEKFLEGMGGVQMRTHLATFGLLEEDPCPLWSRALVPITTVLSQLIWPVSANFGFAEFLLVTSQYMQLQEYVRLTRDWCDWNEASRRFMLAFAYLNTGEVNKALDQFVESVHGVSKDSFLKTLLRGDHTNPKHAEVVFLLKVIRLFELFDLPHLVVSLASTAIMIAEDGDPNLPTLWSKVFKHHLELGHNDDAYDAMVSNPEPSRRKDCLRQLLVILCERGQLQQLVEFPYIDLHDEVVSILESRARSVDLTAQNYYDLLYSFHIYRGNYRKAGSVMYEYGLRLGREVPGLKGLQRQAKCYLAALNALRLVDPKYAWIVKPGAPDKARVSESDDMENQSPKHSWDGEEFDDQPECNLEVLELSALEREYLLVHARLRLLQKDPDPARMVGPTASAADTVALLCNGGLFDCAINLCRLFNMPLTPVFEGVASRCVRLAKASANFQQGDNEYTANAWAWLEESDIGGIGSHTDVSSSDQAWRVLQLYLEKHEDKATRYHKAVAMKLMSEGFTLPTWFMASYKRMNAAELLRLYLDYDLLEECADLAIEYIDAVLGRGSEYFGLKCCLSYTSPSVWLPYTCIDQLLIALRDVDSDATYRECYFGRHEVVKQLMKQNICRMLYERLMERLEIYHQTVEQVSKDVIVSAQQLAKEEQLCQRSAYMSAMET